MDEFTPFTASEWDTIAAAMKEDAEKRYFRPGHHEPAEEESAEDE